MANYFFDPSAYAVDDDITACGWTQVASQLNDKFTIQLNAESQKVLRYERVTGTVTGDRGWSFDAATADAARENIEMLMLFERQNTTQATSYLFARRAEDGTAALLAGAVLATNPSVRHRTVISGTATTVGSTTIGSGNKVDLVSALRVRINGTTVQSRLWWPANPADPTADEPGTWGRSETITGVSGAGRVGIYSYDSGAYDILRVAFATGGDTATFSTTSTPVSFSGPIGNQTGTEGEEFNLDASTYFSGTETPFAYSVQSGTLPAGLSLNTSTGVISGTPTTAGVSSGLVIRATDDMLNTADSNAFSITIGAAVVVTPPSFTGPNVGSITTPFGTPETLDISARWSGDLPQTFTAIGAWPSGATVSSDGILQISDIVAVGAYSDLVVRATNSAGFADSNAFTLTVEAITYAASFETDVLYSLSGMVQANKTVSWTWVPGGRIGDLAGRDVFDGVGTTTAEGRYLVDEVPEGDGLALVTILGETRLDDQVYLEYGTATEEGG